MPAPHEVRIIQYTMTPEQLTRTIAYAAVAGGVMVSALTKAAELVGVLISVPIKQRLLAVWVRSWMWAMSRRRGVRPARRVRVVSYRSRRSRVKRRVLGRVAMFERGEQIR